MDIEPHYAGKIFFSNPSFTQIYFEAVANAFDAGASEIDISISTDGDISPKNLEIVITDNGQGFTNERFDRFRQLKEPTDPDHKGLGRLVYLQYFGTVSVVSTFKGERRVFTFSNSFKGDSQVTKVSSDDTDGTSLTFKGFSRARLKSYDDLKPKAIKDELLGQFLPTLIDRKRNKNDFKITIQLETTKTNQQKDFYSEIQRITPNDVPELETKPITDITVHAFAEITMQYRLRQGMGDNLRLTAVCVDGRTIPINLLAPNAIPQNHSAIFLFESTLFSGRSDSARQRLILTDDVSEGDLFRLLRNEMSKVLNDTFPEIGRINSETQQRFEEKYPHLSGLFDKDSVGIIDKDEAIAIAQQRFFKKQKEVLESEQVDEATYAKCVEISSRTLAEYILYRDFTIRRLAAITDKDKEEAIHNIIAPRYKVFNGDSLLEAIYNNNAWILDDKFMSFRTILSEARMEHVISAITLNEDAVEEDGRPDISMIFSADPSEVEKVDVVVVEIKRRVADDKESPYAATQLLRRAEKLAAYCPNIQRIWYYGIIEIDDGLGKLLKAMKWVPLFSKGKVFYQDFEVEGKDGSSVLTPIFLVSFDAIVQDAAARNHTFLELVKNDIKMVIEARPVQVGTMG